MPLEDSYFTNDITIVVEREHPVEVEIPHDNGAILMASNIGNYMMKISIN